MNLPNKLVVLRIVLIPFFLFFFLRAEPGESIFRMIALAVFLLAAITDYWDGYFARKWGMVTSFGKLMDPLADKMLVTSALVALAARQELSAWVVVLVLCREFLVTGLRQLAIENGSGIISASIWGKLKTVVQITMIACLVAGMGTPELFGQFGFVVAQILIYATVIITVFSAVDYVRDYRAGAGT